MPLELKLNAPRELAFVPYDDPPLQSGEVRAQAIISGISHGTELNLFTGNSPFVEQEFDHELRLFVPRSEPLSGSILLGYEWIGEVMDIAPDVSRFRVGDRVHLPYRHRQTHTFHENTVTLLSRVAPLPDGFSSEQGIFLALAGVALQAIHDAHIKLGDYVVVFGMGVIGLLAVQLAKLNGASWVAAVDPLKSRRELALRFAADAAFDPVEEDAAYAIKASTPYHGADIAIEFSGSYRALNDAIRVVKMGGTVVSGGFYRGGGTPLKLGAEWHHNRVTLLSSMGVWGCPHRDHPTWDRERIHQAAIRMLAAGQLKTDGLVTHRIPFEEAADAYQLIESTPEDAIKVILTY
ncbi:MAG: zinc-binding alcohol dehydrogenase [Chloroflexota bacterium]|nr:zinc-binding alcohol dehydrogenase [Chloroflexota bacterium]